MPACPDYSVLEQLFAHFGERPSARERAILFAVNEARTPQLVMIFDLDGVLVHSMPLHVLAWGQYLGALGVRVENLERRMHGKRNPELVREFLGDVPDEIAYGHGASKERLFREMLARDVSRFQVPGVVEFLERHKNIPKGVASNAEPANVDFVLEHLGLRHFFRVIVDGFQVDRPKPFPDIYLKAAGLLDADPANCIVFEDSPTGVEAAREAGMRIVGVETTPTVFKGVDLKIENFLDPQLEPWFQTQHPV